MTMRFPFPARDERGMTLVEAITALGIMTLVLVMVAQIFAVSTDVFAKQMARNDNDTGAVLAARTIAEIARGASSVEASADVGGTVYASSSSVLVLRMPTISPANQVVTDSFDLVAIYRDATDTARIYAVTDAAAGSKRFDGTRLVTDNNAVMTFRYNDSAVANADRVQVYLVNRQTVRGTEVETEAWTSIFLRNF